MPAPSDGSPRRPELSADGPILVTGGAGKTGRAVIAALAARGARVRAAVRRDGQRSVAIGSGAAESVVADLEDRAALERAASGCRAIYLICPNMHPAEPDLARNALAAADASGLERFVYHSVLHPLTEKMPHHWSKLRVEEALLESGLAWTVLQPGPYMQNLLVGWSDVRRRGVYRVPYSVRSRICLVDLLDVAEAAARVLLDPGYRSASYPLVGVEALDQEQVAAVLETELGRAVRALQTPRAEVAAGLAAAGLGEYARRTLLAMFDYYDRFGLAGNPSTLSWLLGRRPTSLAEFVRREDMNQR